MGELKMPCSDSASMSENKSQNLEFWLLDISGLVKQCLQSSLRRSNNTRRLQPGLICCSETALGFTHRTQSLLQGTDYLMSAVKIQTRQSNQAS